MAASTPSIAQLFFDAGSGYREQDSATQRIDSKSLNDFQPLSFPIRGNEILNLRFDPLTSEGRFSIRNIRIQNGSDVLLEIPLSDVKPLNQIASCTPSGNAVVGATIPGATDPSLTFSFPGPLQFQTRWTWRRWRRFAVLDFLLCAGATCVILFWPKRLTTWLTERQKLPFEYNPSIEFIPFDSVTKSVYAVALAAFMVAGALKLDGSSEGMFKTVLGRGAAFHALLGEPRAVRSDEWGYQTPDVLNQSTRADRFAVEHSVLGDHDVSLIANVPVRHLTALFRPQFWPFFILPVNYAFAFYWQAKALLLFTGVFTFLLWITRSNFWALTGALWYYFSPFTQWTYSWPSAIPEMVGSLCFATVLFPYLTVSRNRLTLLLGAIGAAAAAIDFAMCAYVPHLVPLVWLSLGVLGGWCWAYRRHIFTKQGCFYRAAVIAFALATCAGVACLTYADLKVAITAIARTAYPGTRITMAGTISPWEFPAHLLEWFETEQHFPALLGNVCEGAGFLWLAPATLVVVAFARLRAAETRILIALWAVALLLSAWLIFPQANSLGRFLGLDRTFGSRAFPALGLANIAIVTLSMAALARCHRQWKGFRVGVGEALSCCLVFAILLPLLQAANRHVAGPFSAMEITASAALGSVLIFAVFTRRQWLLAAGLVVPSVFAFGRINPVERGLPVITRSDLHKFVQQHPALLVGRWLIYSDQPVYSGFFAALGCQVYTGTRYLPDIDHFSLLAQHGVNANDFNRLGYLEAHPIPPSEHTSTTLLSPVLLRWNIAPSDPILRQIGIKYLAFDSQPPADEKTGLLPLFSEAVDGFWLFEIPQTPASGGL